MRAVRMLRMAMTVSIGFGALMVRAAESSRTGEMAESWMLEGALVALAGALAWFAGRRAGQRARELKDVMEAADCLVWRAKVRLTDGGCQWREFMLQDTELSRRLFGGHTPRALTGLWDYLNVPELQEMDQRCRAALANGRRSYTQQFHIVQKDGRTVWLRENASITPLGDRQFQLVGVVMDITAHREAEQARRESEDRLRQLLSRADCMLWQAQITADENQRFTAEWFIPKSELYRRIAGENASSHRAPWDRRLVPEYPEMEARGRRAILEGEAGYEQEFRVVLEQGVVLWLHEQVSIHKLGERAWRLEGVVVDVTEQREAAEVKRAAEAQLRHVVETADFLLWHARVFQTPDGELHWLVQAPSSTLYRRLYGREPSGSGALPWRELVAPQTLAEMENQARAAIVGGDRGYEREVAGHLKGQLLWLHEQATIRRVGAGEWQLVGIVTDVTSRHQAEEARLASERALRELLERADCLLWRSRVTRTADGKLQWQQFELPNSRLLRELFGNQTSINAKALWVEACAPDLEEMNVRSAHAINRGASGYEQEFRAVKGQQLFWLREQVTIFPAGDNEWHLVGVVTNVTQQREALEAQRRSEARLEQLLERADCMIWQGHVQRQADGELRWTLYVPRSRLHRRIFGRDPEGSHEFNWESMNVPESAQMRRTVCTALSSGAPGYEQVFHIPKPDGDIWVTEQVSVQRTADNAWEVVGVITDITARREAEEARRASEARLRKILELAECMVWEATVTEQEDSGLDWNFYTTRSVLFRRLFGEDADERDFSWGRLDVPELAEVQQRAAEAVRRHESGYEQEFRVVVRQRLIWLHEVVTISRIGPGQSRLVGVITDVTARREAQEALRASQSQVEQLLAMADCMLWQARVFEITPGKLHWVMFVPRSYLHRELFGSDPDESTVFEWQNVTDAQTFDGMVERSRNAILSGADGYEQEFRAQRGNRVFWLHEQVTITAVSPGEWRLVGVIMDLTERRAAEQAVRASEQRYRTLFQHMPVAIVEADFTEVGRRLEELRASGVRDLATALDASPRELWELAKRVRIVDWNEAAMRMLRAKSKRDFHRRGSALATESSQRAIRLAMLQLWEGRNTLAMEMDVRDFEGGLHNAEIRWWLERNEKGLDLRQSVMVFVDLSELKRAEAALAAEKERLAVTFRAMVEGVITTDTAGNVQFMNPAAAALTQCDVANAAGRPVGDVCRLANDRTNEPVEVPIWRVTQGDVVLPLPARTKLVMPNGSARLVEGCCAPIHSANSKVIGTVLVFRDVTEHDRLEQELVRATKLESVGVLAGGIAHDFNNILTAVMGNVALAALDVAPESDAGRCLREAEKATLRARDLTQQLLTFAKGGEPVRAAVQLGGIVREMTTFTLHGSRVRAVYDFSDDLWPADADKGQIGRVVQNLVLNAVQAMPEGGTIKLTLRNDRVDGLSRLALVPGNYVQISIEDTGVGIKPEHLSRIFDPYFTTKQTGSGLGLAAVYSIVNKHRGAIDVESQMGSGTTFRIWLPATERESNGMGADQDAPSGAGMKGRLLFMDDEESIRSMAATLLERFGFRVACAADGAEAVRLYQESHDNGDRFTLVMMDLTVPGGMGGREAIEHLRRIDPQVRAIVSSGYSSDPVLANYRQHGFCGFAAKPYEVNDLARVLREALGDL